MCILLRRPQLYWDAELMRAREGCGGEGEGFVVGVGGLESSFVVQMSPGPLGHAPHDLAPLLVALNYFTQLEVTPHTYIHYFKYLAHQNWQRSDSKVKKH